MNLTVYFSSQDGTHNTALKAFANGFRRIFGEKGLSLRHAEEGFDGSRSLHPRIHCVFGVRKQAVSYSEHRGKIIDYAALRGEPCIVLETGYVKRDRYYAAGFDGLNGHADFRNTGMPGDRWAALETELHPWRYNQDGPFIVAGQVPWDASVQHINFQQWARATVLQLRSYGFVSVFRPHPKFKDGAREFEYASSNERLENTQAVCCFNSNFGVDALIAGIPVVAYGTGHMYGYCATHTPWVLARPDRTGWANDLAYTQWTLDEMEQGLTWKHLFRTQYRSRSSAPLSTGAST